MPGEEREITLNLLSKNKMGKGAKDAADDLNQLGKAVDATSKRTEMLTKVGEQARKQMEKFGDESDDTSDKVEALSREIEITERELATLARSFADASTAAERLDISKAIRRTENDIRRLNKSKGILSAFLPDPGGQEVRAWGVRFSQGINNSIVGSLASRSLLTTAGGVVGATLAPTIGGLISAAVVGSVGAGGIMGGLALAASSNDRIKGWGQAIGKSFADGVKVEAQESFTGPLNDSMGKLEALADRSVTKIGKIFDNVAPSTGKFVDSAVRSVDRLLDALGNVSEKVEPVMSALGRLIEGTSGAVGRFLETTAKYSKEGASALDDLTSAVTNAIGAVTKFVEALAMVKRGLDSADATVDSWRYKLEDLGFALDLTADGYKVGSEAAELYRKGIIGAAGSVNDYTAYLRGAVTGTKNLEGSQLEETEASKKQKNALEAVSAELRAQVDPAFGVLNAQQKVREAQEELTKSTKKYGENSTQARQAARELAEQSILLQGAVGALGDTFDGELTPAMRATMRAAGVTEPQINAIAREFRAARRAGDAFAKTYRARVITEYINKYSNVVTGAAQSAYEQTKKEIEKRASGGPVVRGIPYVVGENGPEIMVSETPGRVLNASASRGLMTSAATKNMAGVMAGMNGGPRKIEITVGGDDTRLVSLLKYLIRTANVIE